MNTKVYVDNLAPVTTEGDLKKLFSAYGNVVDVNIAVDHASHKPRGFGFVTMVTPENARAAPVQIARAGVVDGVLPAPMIERREGQHTGDCAQGMIGGC